MSTSEYGRVRHYGSDCVMLDAERPTQAAVFALASASILTVGFLGYVYVAGVVGARSIAPEELGGLQRALVIYAKTMLVKGLLPQLGLSLVAWAVFDATSTIARRVRYGRALGLFACASVANVIVVQALLLESHAGMPAVKFVSQWNAVRTFLEMTTAVTAAALIPRWLGDRWWRRASAASGAPDEALPPSTA